jgi:hypothetical protein
MLWLWDDWDDEKFWDEEKRKEHKEGCFSFNTEGNQNDGLEKHIKKIHMHALIGALERLQKEGVTR